MTGLLRSDVPVATPPVSMQEKVGLTETVVLPPAIPKKLLFVTPRYLPFVGGVQNHVHQVGSRLARSGVEVTVLTTNPGKRLPAEEISDDIQIRRVPAWPADRDYYLAPQIYSTITSGSWDLVHVQSYHTRHIFFLLHSDRYQLLFRRR